MQLKPVKFMCQIFYFLNYIYKNLEVNKTSHPFKVNPNQTKPLKFNWFELTLTFNTNQSNPMLPLGSSIINLKLFKLAQHLGWIFSAWLHHVYYTHKNGNLWQSKLISTKKIIPIETLTLRNPVINLPLMVHHVSLK